MAIDHTHRVPQISGDPYKLRAYRIEWRPTLTSHWMLITQVDDHPGDLSAYLEESRDGVIREAASRLQGGQWRVITQHVIIAKGLGA